MDNLRGLHLLSWPRADVEPLGSTVLIACLGTIAVRRVFKDAERLLAMDKELGVARRIQASILPHAMPKVAGLSVAARYEPMTAVAGDFYDFLEVGAKRLGVLVADVSGHGVPAALIASMVKVAIAAQTGPGRSSGRGPRGHERDARGASRRPVRHRRLSLPRPRGGPDALQRGRPPAAPALAPRRAALRARSRRTGFPWA